MMLPLKKIVCPTDFSEPSYEGLKAACELAVHFSAELLLVHVVSPMPTMHASVAPTGFHIASVLEEMLVSAKNSLEEVKREKISADIQTRTFGMTGRPADEIVRLAADEDADIIVIATHGESGWRRFIFGSVAEKVVRLSDCPVLTVRAPDAD